MEKNELLTLVQQIRTADDLVKNEARLVQVVNAAVERELQYLGGNEDRQNLINKCVNSFAATLREEVGLMNAEACKVLERVRVVSPATIKRDKTRK